MRSIVLEWSLDGATGKAFLALLACLAGFYMNAARRGRQHDRRRRRWPARRTAYFSAACLLLVIDLYSWLGTQADRRVDIHMIEHMIMWSVVAPLIAASAPLRLAFYASSSSGRRRLAAFLHTRVVSVMAEPMVATGLFSVLLIATQVPAVYRLTLSNDYVHEAEHGLYLFTATLMWASLLRVDPVPRRSGSRREVACILICTAPMALISLWLALTDVPVYGRVAGSSISTSMHDQRRAAIVMAIACLPALAVLAHSRMRGQRSSSSARNPIVAGADLRPGSTAPPSTRTA